MAETGYLLTVALVTPLSSYFKRKLKLRTIFLTAIVLCITGCLMAACTLNFPMLMTARILQGAGTGIALPLMFNIILEQSSKSKIGMLMGVGGMVVAVAPALGPTVGGLVGTFMPWRWIFVILLPFLFVSLVYFPASGFSHPLEESARIYTPELSRFFQRVEGSGHELTYREHSSYRLDAKARRSASMAVNIGRTGPNLSSSDPETGALAAPSNTTPAASTDAPNPSCEAFGII